LRRGVHGGFFHSLLSRARHGSKHVYTTYLCPYRQHRRRKSSRSHNMKGTQWSRVPGTTPASPTLISPITLSV
jgi:hypothetical protein